ncbi:MAG: hypothetical protein SOW46_13535 [Candidatus Aphodomonas sp.]|nr:hypothetical protein [Candidatus Aphodomonas sp.]
MGEKKKKNGTKAGNGQKNRAFARFLRRKMGGKTGKKGPETAEKGRFWPELPEKPRVVARWPVLFPSCIEN